MINLQEKTNNKTSGRYGEFFRLKTGGSVQVAIAPDDLLLSGGNWEFRKDVRPTPVIIQEIPDDVLPQRIFPCVDDPERAKLFGSVELNAAGRIISLDIAPW